MKEKYIFQWSFKLHEIHEYERCETLHTATECIILFTAYHLALNRIYSPPPQIFQLSFYTV